jgi:hypothetical protein
MDQVRKKIIADCAEKGNSIRKKRKKTRGNLAIDPRFCYNKMNHILIGATTSTGR